jgi:hypothetical protein
MKTDKNRAICHFPKGIMAVIMTLLLLSSTAVIAYGQGNMGTITVLTANDAPVLGDTITVDVTVCATTKIVNSNVIIAIIAPDGSTVVDTSTTAVPKNLGPNACWSFSWSTTNSAYPDIGTYTVSACWSTGGATNCDIDYAETTIFSVPVLGWYLVPLLGMIGYILWRNGSKNSFGMKAGR